MVESRVGKPLLYWGSMVGIVMLGVFGVPAFSRWLGEVTGTTAREAAAKQAAEAAREVAEHALRADFEETGGVNLERLGEPPSYMVTLRESAKLAPSEAEHWAQVIARVKRESGCPSLSYRHFPAEGLPGLPPTKPASWVFTPNC